MCILVDSFVDAVRKAIIPVGVYGAIEFATEQTNREKYGAFMKSFDAFQVAIPQARKLLEAEFRSLLGVEPGK